VSVFRFDRAELFFEDALDFDVFDVPVDDFAEDFGAALEDDFFDDDAAGWSCAKTPPAATNATQRMTTGRDFDFTAVTLILRENRRRRMVECSAERQL
jgi:hypothetical protein